MFILRLNRLRNGGGGFRIDSYPPPPVAWEEEVEVKVGTEIARKRSGVAVGVGVYAGLSRGCKGTAEEEGRGGRNRIMCMQMCRYESCGSVQ